MSIDPRYKADPTPAQEYTPECAFHLGVCAVVTVRIDGVQRDVCQRCWRRIRDAARRND